MGDESQGSVLVGFLWICFLSILLFWAPVVGPLVAGFVGGIKAGGVGAGIMAVILPGVILGLLMFFFGAVFTGLPVVGAVFAAGGFILVVANVGLLLLGAIVGGAVA